MIEVKNIYTIGYTVKADITISCCTGANPGTKSISISAGDDLYPESNFSEIYRSGFFIESIDAQTGILFANGTCLLTGEKYEL